MLDLRIAMHHPDLLLGVLEAEGVVAAPSTEAFRDNEVARELAELAPDWPDEARRSALRDLLRGHGYKPTGRGKPASEYLCGAAARGEFPSILNLVDINNLLSLRTAWPMSILDLDRALCDAPGLELRLGQTGESYVFNAAGHVIELAGLLGIARQGGVMLANPVKDAMTAKVDAQTSRAVVFVYTSRRVTDRDGLRAELEAYGALLRQHAAASDVLIHDVYEATAESR